MRTSLLVALLGFAVSLLGLFVTRGSERRRGQTPSQTPWLVRAMGVGLGSVLMLGGAAIGAGGAVVWLWGH